MKWTEEKIPKEYKEHEIFKNLDFIDKFYNFLSYNSFRFLPNGLPGTFPNIDTYIISSIKGTIDSVRLLLRNAHLNDAFAIARKYFDEIMLDIYISVYRQEQIKKHPNVLLLTVERIKKWKDESFNIPRYDDTIKYLKRSESYRSLFSFFDFEKRYRKIRELLDDNMHMNSYQLMITNDNEILNQYRIRYLNILNTCISDLFCYHFASCIYLNPQYFMASDYFDYLELGQTPPKGSENWIAPMAQEVFDKVIKPKKDLAIFLTENVCLEINGKFE